MAYTTFPSISLLVSALFVLGSCQYGYRSAYRPSGSMCETIGYRELPIQVQNEHQCLVLEQLDKSFKEGSTRRDDLLNQIIARIIKLDSKINKEMNKGAKKYEVSGFPLLKDVPAARDCNELRMAGIKISGVYPLQMPNRQILNVWCDMDTQGGGWTVVQQRLDGESNFTRKWNDYAVGFGNVNTNYWIGNENLHSLSTATRQSLRVDMWDWDDNHAFALYHYFHVDSEATGYLLTVEGYDEGSTAGDSLIYHNKMKFTTVDRDNDAWWANCAMKDQSGWWFNQCSYCSLNGIFRPNGTQEMSPDGTSTGITWYHWKQIPGYSLKRVQMKIKPIVAVTMEGDRPAHGEGVFN